jgi:tripartite-type tricarboxylate transporter receptor subunit TctC
MPKGTPEHVVKKWEAAIAKMTQDPAFIEKLQAIQVEPSYANSTDFTSHVQQETGYYTDLATKRGIRK